MAFEHDFVYRCVVRRTAKRNHDAGGCNAKDGYNRGYGDAVTPVLNIVLEETGYEIEKITIVLLRKNRP